MQHSSIRPVVYSAKGAVCKCALRPNASLKEIHKWSNEFRDEYLGCQRALNASFSIVLCKTGSRGHIHGRICNPFHRTFRYQFFL
jgi:hypothetical protein